jgi:hypothetical protein
MWIFMSDSFLSVVNHKNPKMLTVRARVAGDIENVFPKAKVAHTPKRDYYYRTTLPREQVAKAIADSVAKIDYNNFKNSVSDNGRHNALLECWTAMWKWGRGIFDIEAANDKADNDWWLNGEIRR